VDALRANNWNPNVVMNQELKLLEFSILKQGWIQGIMVNKDMMIIDGFHRYSLSKQSKALRERYCGMVPCYVLPLDDAQAMLLTIRINRAKGSHVAHQMHEIVRTLIDEHGMDHKQIEQEIGAHRGGDRASVSEGRVHQEGHPEQEVQRGVGAEKSLIEALEDLEFAWYEAWRALARAWGDLKRIWQETQEEMSAEQKQR